MPADIEVRHWRSLVTAAAPVAHERFPGSETRQVRQRLTFVIAGRQQLIEFFDGLVTHRDLGIDQGVDDHSPGIQGHRDLLGRPVGPLLVTGDDIEQHAGIYQRGRSDPRGVTRHEAAP